MSCNTLKQQFFFPIIVIFVDFFSLLNYFVLRFVSHPVAFRFVSQYFPFRLNKIYAKNLEFCISMRTPVELNPDNLRISENNQDFF
jgi:hypothetical protein